MTHIDQGGMVDDWWQSAPEKITAPPTLRWKSGGGGNVAIFPVNTVTKTVSDQRFWLDLLYISQIFYRSSMDSTKLVDHCLRANC